MKRKSFILEGNNVHTNHGCEAIDRGTYRILRDHFPDCRIINCGGGGKNACGGGEGVFQPEGMTYSYYPRKYSPAWNLRKLKRLMQGRIRSKPYLPFPFEPYLKEADAVLTLGGDNWSLDYQTPHFILDSSDAIKKSGAKMVHWCSSIGRFDGNESFKKQVLERLRRYDLLLVRESYTVDYLKSEGICENVKQVADPAFLMEPVEKMDLQPGLSDLLSGGECLGINLAARLGAFPENRENYQKNMVSLIRKVADGVNAPIVLIPHVMDPEGVYCDQKFLREIEAAVGQTKYPIVALRGDWNAVELKWLISKMAAFAGARTHSTIAALSSRVPTCFLSYSLKSKGICYDVSGSLDYLVSIKSAKIEDIIDTIGRVWAEREIYRTRMGPIIDKMEMRASMAGEHLAKLLQKV